jgi:hypothetical protein
MQKEASNKPVAEIVAAINALDLDAIKFKLMDPEEGQGWSREYVDRMEIAYKRFLTVWVKYPDDTIAPGKDVDKFWHAHILDTLKYAEDCQKVFGYFLHHFPYVGMRGEADAALHARAADAMARLYQQEFGEAMPRRAAYCGASKQEAAYCGASKTAEHAYCGASKRESAAYCGASKPAETTAYCGASKTAESAYCGATAKREAAAYCGASKQESAAYCGASKTAENAYCGASKQESAAYCGASERSAGDQLNTAVRPKLPKAA